MKDADDLTWLVLKAQSGDRDSLNRLLRAIQEPLYLYIRRLVDDRQLAEEVLQETLVTIWRKLGTVQEVRAFPAWAYRTASREAFRHLKRERRWTDQVRDDALLEAVPTDSLDSLTLEQGADWAERLSLLTPASRAVVDLHYGHGLTLEEVAAVLEIPVGTVKSRLTYGLARLRQQQKEKEP